MKKKIRHLLSLGFLFFTFSGLYAQTSGFCGNPYTEEIDVCFDKSDFTQALATETLRSDLLAGYSCSNTQCPRPAVQDCEAKIVSIPSPSISTTQFCFSGTVNWKCTRCKRQPLEPVPDEEAEPTEGMHSNHDELAINAEQTIHHSGSQDFGKIQKVFPNPTNDILRVQVQLEQEGIERVQLSLANLQGKQLASRVYKEVPASLFNAQINVSDLPSGIYLLSVSADNELIGTSKVIVQ